MESEELFPRRWLYKQIGNDIKGLIVDNREDYELLVKEGYKDSPKKCKEEVKEIKEEVSEVKEKDSVEEPISPNDIDYDSLSWNELRGKAKELEKLLGVEIIKQGSNKESILNRIKELLNKD